MTGTDLAVREQALATLTNDQLSYIANTEFVPPGLRGNLPAILACVATGRAIGIPDMTALRSIHVIDGKATFSAELMVLLVRRGGHSITGATSEGVARVTGKRADNGDEMTVEWTTAMAERAGLLGKQNWRKYPEAMLWARAVSQLCRMLFADCFAGASYTPEELEESAGEPSKPGSVGTGAESPTTASAAGADSSPAEDDVPFYDEGEPVPPAVERDERPATAPMKKKLDVLVKGGDNPPALRRVYATVAQIRVQMTDSLIADVGGFDDAGELHWSPLRDSLTRDEAHKLIDRLEAYEREAKP